MLRLLQGEIDHHRGTAAKRGGIATDSGTGSIASLEWFAAVLKLMDHGEAWFQLHKGGIAL